MLDLGQATSYSNSETFVLNAPHSRTFAHASFPNRCPIATRDRWYWFSYRLCDITFTATKKDENVRRWQ